MTSASRWIRGQIVKALREKGIELRFGDHAFATATLQGILHALNQPTAREHRS
ncbi:hypothetical protein [Mycobacteroides abscessus]|uniref:hypothetical protein n=1 Tax=Mycobacteroides abscessus TaxID=36809 RepID=UPI0016019AAC|nr:hypothetical protein [Mycobacteroides abscessus]